LPRPERNGIIAGAGSGGSGGVVVAVDVPVLIVGGGPVGLALAADLGWRGVPCLLIEQGDGTIPQPKMLTVGARTMEYCRRWGIAKTVREAAIPRDYPRVSLYATSLNGKEVARFTAPGPGNNMWPYGPEPRERCAQTLFDPILRRFAGGLAAVRMRYGCKLVALEQDAERVTATLEDAATGRTERVTAAYLVGCDGAGSFVRRALGIETVGLERSARSMNIFFECDDLFSVHDKGPILMFHLLREDGGGLLTTIDGRRQWRLSSDDFPADYVPSEADAARRVRRAVGADFPFQITAIVVWARRHVIAERYRAGRAFLAGDAAHQLTNAGGFGMNTGIGDALDLSWKLEAAVAGWAGPRLLDSYEAERRPIGVRNIEEARANMADTRGLPVAPEIDEDSEEGERCRQRVRDAIFARNLHRIEINPGIELGYRYEGSPVIVADGTPPPPIETTTYTQIARPGSRAPHAWLDGNGGRSTIDAFGRGFVLMTWRADGDTAPIADAAQARGAPLAIAKGPPEAAELYGNRLVLVRPDGHVAWRGDKAPADPLALIDTVRGAGTG
jgi:2-polyprenyl-6-methoxyphenol hydroxylase-like FAD-dependent oxidoreductase